LWHVDLLLGGNHETGDCTVAAPRQRPANNRGMLFSARSIKQQLNSKTATVFFVQSMQRCYKQNNWSNESVAGQSPAGKNMSMEAEDIVGIRHQATTGEGTANREDLVHAVVNCRVCELVIAPYLLVITICKCSINPIINPNPVYSHSICVTIFNVWFEDAAF
jgi:hypothetical protein